MTKIESEIWLGKKSEKKTIINRSMRDLKDKTREQKLRWATSVDCVSGESQVDDENSEWERESESFWRNQGFG